MDGAAIHAEFIVAWISSSALVHMLATQGWKGNQNLRDLCAIQQNDTKPVDKWKLYLHS